MPVSALRYEPRVDLQSRNLAEGQSDVTVRGGTFENTGFRVGALTVGDPQTGHYLAELPIAPAMLGAPEVATGASLFLAATNATVGAIVQEWRPIRNAGAAVAVAGESQLRRAELYQGRRWGGEGAAVRWAGDLALATSESDGPLPGGDHEFFRGNLRLQRQDGGAQTDALAGYQAKRFGWPNLYTPFNSSELENLQTTLWVINHRVGQGADGSVEMGAFHRRNKDDYAFNRFAPVGPVHPFQHTTWLSGAAAEVRRQWMGLEWEARGEVQADQLQSTSLTAGRYMSRSLARGALAVRNEWATDTAGGRGSVRVGVGYDDTNRGGGAVTPLLEFGRTFSAAGLRRFRFGYAKSTQVPSYTALNSSAVSGLFRGNRDLGRSASHNLEVAVEGSLDHWALEAAAFFRRDRSLVDWTFRRGVVARTANAVDVDTAGLELVARRSWTVLDLVLGYTALDKDPSYRGAAVDASFYALNYARHRLTLAAVARLGGGVELRIDNAARWQAENLLRTQGGRQALNSSVGLVVRPRGWPGWEFTARVDNVWDDPYQEVPAVPASPRQWSVGLGYAW
ncbi:MAG: TonB-dependent receptor [Verrucomicrobia bacterium]|nr:TonB-dependent receptor [Verrucomicrobiota bacterium]